MSRSGHIMRLLGCWLVLLGLLLPGAASSSHAASTSYQTGFAEWRDFSSWARSGTALSGAALQLSPASAASATDPYAPNGYCRSDGVTCGNFYNGGSFLVGEATSPAVSAPFNFREAIASWNADTPSGSWVETQVRVQLGGSRWSKWYNLGIWASDYSTIERHSVRAQGDSDGYVAVDTLVVSSKSAVSAYQLKVRLFQASGSSAIPTLRYLSLGMSTTPSRPRSLQAGNSALWNTLLNVPECSQMVYPDGGEVWCSPTSVSMVLGYWQQRLSGSTGACEPRVRAAVDGVFDWVYDGHGNWPFNTAYAAATGGQYAPQGLEARVARFTSMREIEKWVSAGVPVVISYAWSNNLTGAPLSSSAGHLALVVGFDAQGNPIVNDPAASTNEDVQRTYLRSELESLWLEHSGGTVYLIHPVGWSVPSL